ncbi:PIG-L family deacetylase [Austwickia sp. TVS 96-490-7B]|uniref:PIG-L family deacetylase n=1 Tax=Austwickia sp. TVS 96-490-7B TaxID=2830843 RepID=UPI001C590ED1|nr:PIG-L family deacetylase [Austwickia sp. TVS 96-490-7B]
MSESARRTLLFVHAHPDDETLATGVTLAQRVLDGDDVHVLTMTLGDEGEIIPADLAHHAADQQDTLGSYRRGELAAAMTAIGATSHVLGETDTGTATYRDSGMAGTPSMEHPRALCGAPLAQVGAAIGAVLAELAPDVVVTYDPRGGYDHPDHLRTHQATCVAVAALPPDRRPALWAVVVDQDQARQDRAWLSEHAPSDRDLILLAQDDPYPPGVVPSAMISWKVTGSPQALDRRDAALRAHATQVQLGAGWHALSNHIAARSGDTECYVRLDPDTTELVPAVPGEEINPCLAP